MARNLDAQLHGPSAVNPSPGFAFANRASTPISHLPTPGPPPGVDYSNWSPWAGTAGTPQPPSYIPTPAFAPLPAPAPPPLHPPSDALPLRNPHDSVPPPSKSPSALPTLTAPLPTIPNLTAALPSIQQPNSDPAVRMAWARDVIFLVDRIQSANSTDSLTTPPPPITDPQLLRLSQFAAQTILQIANTAPMPNPIPSWVAEAIYFRATFASSGAYPDLLPKNPRNAFRDFETAARAGYAAAWFRLGRDYETFQDFVHAKDCFERGVILNVESCCYRMGMAHLLGQLDLPVSFEIALPLLLRAATLASLEVPQPAYIYSLLLLNEFKPASVPLHLFSPLIPPNSSIHIEARKHLERAAYLNFAPAQYKLGHAYELAQPPFPFDALLSVQYYSLASQQGEPEADMALSKWFLCGSEGAFEKDEGLAYTFADKAARKGLPSAEFALGYYAEVGVGRSQDLDLARRWYKKAAEHGNADAIERLAALSQPAAQSLSRQEHDAITEHKLVRTRTQARERSDTRPPTRDGRHVIETIRKNSVRHASVDQAALAAVHEGPREEPPRPFPGAQRYSLADQGSPGPSRGQSPGRGQPQHGPRPHKGSSPLPPAKTPPPQQAATPVVRPAPSPGKGPATFAEMGIHGAKAEDKDCIIM